MCQSRGTGTRAKLTSTESLRTLKEIKVPNEVIGHSTKDKKHQRKGQPNVLFQRTTFFFNITEHAEYFVSLMGGEESFKMAQRLVLC